jgi:chromate transporter
MADAVSTQEFIFGYGAAQGMPGPMFTMATFLGARLHDSEPLLGAVLATLAIFLPGFLLILALKDTWQNISDGSILSRASWGINAAVIGFLVAAFYQPIFTSAVSNYIDILMIILGFIGIRIFKLSILIMIMLFLASSLFRVLLF